MRIAIIIGLLPLLLSGCTGNFTSIDGFASLDECGLANLDIRIYSEEQVKEVISDLSLKSKSAPAAGTVYRVLLSKSSIAKTTSGHYSGKFCTSVPLQGNFVIAADAYGYGRREKKDGKLLPMEHMYWLVPFKTTGEHTYTVKLSERNRLSALSPVAL